MMLFLTHHENGGELLDEMRLLELISAGLRGDLKYRRRLGINR